MLNRHIILILIATGKSLKNVWNEWPREIRMRVHLGILGAVVERRETNGKIGIWWLLSSPAYSKLSSKLGIGGRTAKEQLLSIMAREMAPKTLNSQSRKEAS